MVSIKQLALFALSTGLATVDGQSTGKTTRYWDCCKASCSWPDKASVIKPVTTCSKDNTPFTDANTPSACNGGSAYTCTDQSPWEVNKDLAYGFAAVKLAGQSESNWCCTCYELTFTSGAINGKKMIVQATNTGSDLGSNHFDIAMPGGGLGIFNDTCTAQWGEPVGGWGAQYDGLASRAECGRLAAPLQAGCHWRFDWFMNANNPDVTFKEVTCPTALTDKTGCKRN